jgi:O-succinylbenzoate synthase
MELREIELIRIIMPLKEAFETSFGSIKDRPCILVRAVERGGEEGWGEVVAGEGPWYSYETVDTAWHVLKDFILPLIGKDIEPEEFHKRVSRIRGHNMAKAGVEEALWDLKAKLEEKPLYEVIGGVRRSVEVGVSVGIKGSLSELLRSVNRFIEEGYHRIKLKVKPGWDVEVVEGLRTCWPDIDLQVDANGAYSLRDAEHLRKLDGFNLLMVEQPLAFDDLVDHAELARRLRTPLCLDESIKGLGEAKVADRLGSCEIINIKPGRVGGLVPSKAIHDLWYSKKRGVWIGGTLETGIGRGHLVALATLKGVRYPSDISASDRYYEEEIVEPPWIQKEGKIDVRKAAGIGVDVLYDKIEKIVEKKQVFKI